MDKYQRVKVLGKGSFGSAILIKRKTDGLLFVVKEVGMTRMSKKERDEARHECTVLQQLQHPNIVRYVEQFENNNNLYIVMEYCDGGDLAEKVKHSRGPMKESSMLYYFSQICLAIEYLHARHILHRDIKTMNVFLMKNGAVKLGDFGISTVLRTTMGMANTVCGTPYYFSPELCRNRPYNNKSDIWALGVLLYECATGGRHPFDGTSMNQLMQRIVQGHYAPLSSQYSSDFRKMVDWCLQKDPAKRPSIKQTLALPLMRRSLEQLEENLMLATQCRVRLKDIIDFEGGMDQEERKGSSPQPSPKLSPRAVAKDGVSPGQAAALAMARQNLSPVFQPPTTPSHSPIASPERGGGAPAAVGPKPSAAVPQSPTASPKQGNEAHRFYSPCQKRPIANPLLPGGGARPAPAESPSGAVPPPLAQRPLEEPHHTPPLRIKVTLGGAGDRRGLAAAALPAAAAAPAPGPSPNAADAFHADMRRVDAIIARYGRNSDEKAKETIHAYMRRKHEAYLKRQKEEIEARERRNRMRKEELRRVLENQRMAVSPLRNNDPRNSPHLNNINMNGYPDDRSPRRGSPQPRAKPENVHLPSRSPPSSPLQDKEPVSARTPTNAEPAVFGRDPRRGAPPGEPASRPTTPQQQRVLQQPPSPAAAAPNGNPLPQTPPRRVLYAANSPQQAHPPSQNRTEAPEARRAVTPDPLHSPPSRLGAPRGAAFDIDRRSLPNSKPEAASGGQKAPLTAGLGGGIDGHRMVLQTSQQHLPQPRRPMDAEQLPARRDRRESRVLEDAAVGRRPSALSPISGDPHDHCSPRQAAAAAPERASLSAGDPRLQRPGRALQRYLKPLGGRGEDGVSPLPSPTSAQSPRRGAAGVDRGHRGSSGVPPPVKSKALVSAGNANPPSSAPGELADIPRTAAHSTRAQASPCTPVKEALRALRRSKVQAGAPAPPPSSAMAAGMKDLPAIITSPEHERGARRNHPRYRLEEAALYRGMRREQPSREDERVLVDEHRKPHHAEVSAVPNTLEALRSLRAQQDKAMRAEGGAREEVNPGGQLALLKQRQRMQQRPRQGSTSSSASVPLAPRLMTRATEAAASPRSEVPSGYDRKTPVPRDNAAARPSAAHVTALSLGDVNRGAAPSRAAPPSAHAGAPPSPNPSTGGGAGVQSSMEGYAEMLQHLKDLLQRRRVSSAGGASAPTSPTTAASAPSAIENPRDPGARSPISMRNRALPPPLNPSPLGGVDMSCASDSGDSGVLVSPPHLKATRPLHPQPNAVPVVNVRPGCDAEEEDDDDFEDAVPLSPVRCTELNDAYARQQDQQEQKWRHAQEDVYTSDVDLTSAAMEEELEGEEGYTDYHKRPSSKELPKGIKS
ncbi:serine/threonine-protein kinase Nek1 [Leishmania donovani]|uniref:non-specific serine/threonine protein kinase n=1 Tax=Leishmania donovani TaxID=5661 RepID=A0A6J8FLC7_LEIDO|nr:serine/threonine-protein kinase Nek1 [Leishmania donovani]VDZ47399.1 Serine/threonine-protein_kinase_Nek1-related_putative/GeneDB:LmjF.32.0260 [Leishmania donovani]